VEAVGWNATAVLDIIQSTKEEILREAEQARLIKEQEQLQQMRELEDMLKAIKDQDEMIDGINCSIQKQCCNVDSSDRTLGKPKGGRNSLMEKSRDVLNRKEVSRGPPPSGGKRLGSLATTSAKSRHAESAASSPMAAPDCSSSPVSALPAPAPAPDTTAPVNAAPSTDKPGPNSEAHTSTQDAVVDCASGVEDSVTSLDVTQIPKELDDKFLALDPSGAVRPAIITPAKTWSKMHQKDLLGTPQTTSLGADELGKDKRAAFGLLDALTKSGGIVAEYADLHVVIAAAHCFDKTLIDTIVKDCVNPIEKVVKSTVIIASAVHQRSVEALVTDKSHIDSIKSFSPEVLM
jgi:hypothetical protein